MHLLALIVPTAVALVFFVWNLGGATFLSDDYLLVAFLDPETGGVQWQQIQADFGESWFLSPAYWRPVVSLSYGINIALLGFSPASLYAVNLLLHLVVVAATAELCYRLGSRERPVLAAIFGGVFVALHPVSPEPVLWIAARTTGLEVCFRMCAVVAFVAYLRSGRKTTYGWVFVFSALALASKESAVVLPFYLLFVDLLDSPRRPGNERLLLHAPLFVLWLVYAVVRFSVFGRVLGMAAAQPGGENVFAVLGQKLAMLMALDVGVMIGWVLVVAVTVSLAWGSLKTLLPLLGLGALCLVVSLAPTYNVPLGEGTVGVRMLYGSLPVLAILVCRCLFTGQDSQDSPTVKKRLRDLSAFLLVVIGMPATCAHVGRYQQSWQAMGKAEVEIAELGKDVEVGRPLGLVSVPPCRTVPGPVNPGTYFAFGRRPFTAKPFAIAGLGCLITPPPFSEKLINDPRPLHAFLRAGCPVAAWSEADGAMRFLHKDISATPGSFDAHDGVVTFDPPRSLATIEHIRIRTTGKATGGELPELHIHFFGGVRQGKEKIFDVDVSRNGPSLHEILGGRELADLKVELEVGEVLDVQVKDRVPRLELVRRLDGSRVSAEKLEATIVAPLPKQRAPMHIVLIGESSGFTWSVQAGVPVTIPLPVLDLIRAFAQRLETRRYHYYFQTTAPQQGSPGSARSDLDWFTLDGG